MIASRIVSCVACVFLATTPLKAQLDGEFSAPTNDLGPNVNTVSDEWSPCLSSDGLSLYFSSNRAGGSGDYDIYVATRGVPEGDFGDVENLGSGVNTFAFEGGPGISPDGRELYFNRHGTLWVARRENPSATFNPAVNTWISGARPQFSPNGRKMLFPSRGLGGFGGWDLFIMTRETGPFGANCAVTFSPPL